ncbi:DUF2169 domain-containing protein [Escherichia coli]|uniref:DUF2169 family type VI secretion system accessory protein n=1 Tax=Escherichia sp. MOD1-EC7003 TaxID=2093900 RepID=UPI000CF75E17|nr:DUF2169 domain-containing protein [Escherichia sp. MOD1-EC7003]EGO8362117.1 DUF2169 domain-containing protein [Escherichia coli]EGO8379615.1 DUF2169 domain-containing protein [Escherichia coli]MCH0695912.1 DUF2169 domain-containing protein [Escherichia coli]
MWQIKNQTPYAVTRAWVRGRQGEEIWTVALKATWDIQPDGTTTLSDTPQQVNVGPVMNPDGNTLLYDTDLGLVKNATDIILNGHAIVPDGKFATYVVVGLKVGSVFRLARVYGDRVWNGKRYNEPQPFNKMPLSYNKMSRGDDFPAYKSDFNPAGITVDSVPETGISVLPNIEFYGDETMPGFGAIPRHWPGRLQFAGTYDDRWQKEQSPLLPDDLDERYWQRAPAPLYAGGRLKGGEVRERSSEVHFSY